MGNIMLLKIKSTARHLRPDLGKSAIRPNQHISLRRFATLESELPVEID